MPIVVFLRPLGLDFTLVVAKHITLAFTVYFMRLHLVYRDLSNLKLDERLASFTLLVNSVHTQVNGY